MRMRGFLGFDQRNLGKKNEEEREREREREREEFDFGHKKAKSHNKMQQNRSKGRNYNTCQNLVGVRNPLGWIVEFARAGFPESNIVVPIKSNLMPGWNTK